MRVVVTKAARQRKGMREKGLEKAQPAPPKMGRQTSEGGNVPETTALTCQGLGDSEGESKGMKTEGMEGQVRERKNRLLKHPTPRGFGRITLTWVESRPTPGSDPST